MELNPNKTSNHKLDTKSPQNEMEKSASGFQTSNIIKLSYLVSKEDGQGAFDTIQKAIDAAKTDSVIKISQGLYKEKILIKDKSLKLEAKDMNSEVYILWEDGPAITVENEPDVTVTIERLKLAHKGAPPKTKATIARNKTKEKTVKPTMTQALTSSGTKRFSEETGATTATSGGSSKKGSDMRSSLESYLTEVCFKLSLGDETNCVLFIKSGSVMIRNSIINMNLVVRKTQEYIPAIVALNNSSLVITDCELIGSRYFETVGLLLRESNLLMKSCTLTHFQSGAICLQLAENNTSKIFNSKISFNGGFGIQVIGKTLQRSAKGSSSKRSDVIPEDEEPEIIKDCDIENNSGPGIQICCPNSGLIRKNTISFNKNGIEVICADPRIFDNNISKNTGNGIYVKSMERLYSTPTIRGNCLKSNRENGILCSGASNIARIIYNLEISFNKLCGIKVDNQATPQIMKNIISKNIFQGILIVENASAHIEDNQISENIKANIAFGGQLSSDTIITRNKILKGRCEGIFMIEAGTAYIKDNIISENYDGIIMITSSPEVGFNQIISNKNSGVMIMKDSRPKIYSNILKDNKTVGFFVRDNSIFQRNIKDLPHESDKFWFYNNLVEGTEVGLVVERQISNGKEIVEKNDFSDCQCRIPYKCKEIRCQLI